MTKNQNLDTFDLPGLRDFLLLIGGFATGLCWWIGMTAFVNAGGLAIGGAGFVMFLSVPVLATLAIYRALRRRNGLNLEGSESPRSHRINGHSVSGRHRKRIDPEVSRSHGVHSLRVLNRPATRDFLVIIAGLVMVLCWWIGMRGYMNAGGLAHIEALVFLIVPVLATAGTYLAARHTGSGSRS